MSLSGPQRLFAEVRFRVGSARRGRWYPPGAHAVAVGAARRLHCDARSAVAPQNSLRELRSLRSDNCGESVHEARCARRLRPCASRRPTNRPHRVPPAASSTMRCLSTRKTTVFAKVRAGGRRRAFAQPRSAGLAARARSALRELTRRSCLNAVSAAHAVSSATGPRDRASQGTLAQRGQAAKRRRLPARAFARTALRTHSGRRESPTGRNAKFNARLRFACRGPRQARWRH